MYSTHMHIVIEKYTRDYEYKLTRIVNLIDNQKQSEGNSQTFIYVYIWSM